MREVTESGFQRNGDDFPITIEKKTPCLVYSKVLQIADHGMACFASKKAAKMKLAGPGVEGDTSEVDRLVPVLMQIGNRPANRWVVPGRLNGPERARKLHGFAGAFE